MSILVWIITGIVAGWLAGMAVQGHGFGLIVDLIVGLVGGLIGGLLAGAFGIQPTNWVGVVLVSALGGVILVWFLHLIHPGVA